MLYALHLAIIADDSQIAQQELSTLVESLTIPFPVGEVIVEGDRWVEWGEPVVSDDDELHGLIYFFVDSHEIAWASAEWLYGQLRDTPIPMHTQFRIEPTFQVTLGVLFSAGVGPGGERFGDPDEQVDIEAQGNFERYLDYGTDTAG